MLHWRFDLHLPLRVLMYTVCRVFSLERSDLRQLAKNTKTSVRALDITIKYFG